MCVHVYQRFHGVLYTPANNIWVRIPCVGDCPSSRDGHACTTIGAEMFIHGGFSASVS